MRERIPTDKLIQSLKDIANYVVDDDGESNVLIQAAKRLEEYGNYADMVEAREQRLVEAIIANDRSPGEKQ